MQMYIIIILAHVLYMYMYKHLITWAWLFLGTDNDLEYYVRECAEVLGVTKRLPGDKRTGKHVLEYILLQLIELKKHSPQVSHYLYF